MTEVKKERHPFRFLFKLLLIVGAMTAVTRFLAERRKDFYGLTESEARAKFEEKLGPRIGEEKASAVADQVIPRLKEKGVIKSDVEAAVDEVAVAADEATDQIVDITEEATESMEDTAEKVKEKMD